MKRQNRLQIIECSGSEYEIGRQYGEAARENIRKALSLMFTSMKLMPYQAERDAVTVASQKYRENVRAFDAEALERVQGMADGSGAPFDELFALQCYTELFVNYPGLASLCTSFGLTGPATSNGVTILGQNVDWHPDSAVDLVRIRRRDGRRLLGLFLNGYGCYYLSSSGVGNCANLLLCPPSPVVNHLPFVFYLYAAMRERNAKEAMDVLRKTSRGVGHVLVGDKSGYLAGIESTYDDHAIIDPAAGVLVHANHYESERFKKTDGAYTYIPDSFHRANRLRQLISEAHGTITPESMMRFLGDHDGHPKSVCTHVDPSVPPVFAALSVASWIMVPEQQRMLVAAGPPCEHEYVEYTV